MKKMVLTALWVLAVAVLWLGCFRSEAGQLVGHAGGDFSYKPAAASAEFAGAGAPHSDSISPAITAAGVTTPAVLTQPDVNGPQVPFSGAGRFDHLVADTLPEEAMAPQKSDNADTSTARAR